MFKSAKKGGEGKVLFQDVRASAEAPPQWMDPVSGDLGHLNVVSLRPPKIPTGTGVAESVPPPDSVDPEAAMSWASVLQSAGQVQQDLQDIAPANTQFEVEPTDAKAVRRIDTVIDDLNPRADEEAISAIRDAVAGLVSERQALLRSTEDDAVALVRMITERVLARELSMDPTVVVRLVREGMSALTAADRVRIRVGSFFAEVAEQIEQQVAMLGVEAQVLIDPEVGPHGCRIETEWGSVDESVEGRLMTMLEGLSLYPPPANR